MANMAQISQELLVYKELQGRVNNFEGVLGLYQSQIDRNSYMLIKEPFTENLKFHIETLLNISDVTVQIHNILEKLFALGFYLSRGLRLEDMVVVMNQVKLENVGVLTMDMNKGILNIEDVILELRSSMLDYLG